MGSKTGIAYCDSTWHPLCGCSHASEGCRNCWAEKTAARLAANPRIGSRYAGTVDAAGRWTGVVRLIPEALDVPLRWRKPRRIAVALGGDLFHPGLSDEDACAVLAVCANAAVLNKHTLQVLTKRPARARELLSRVQWWGGGMSLERVGERNHLLVKMPTIDPGVCLSGWKPLERGAPAGTWLGVSAEDQPSLDARVPELLACPAALHWLSLEPLLGPVDLRRVELLPPRPPHGPGAYLDALTGAAAGPDDVLPALRWVVVGCESGPGRRPCALAWVRRVVEQCREAQVACFVKQLDLDGRVSHDPAEWPEDLRVREFPEVLRG